MPEKGKEVSMKLGQLDWQHVALFVVATSSFALSLAALVWYATQTGNAALMAVAIPAISAFIATVGSLLKRSVLQTPPGPDPSNTPTLPPEAP
jgi:hypothetical protein